MTNALKEGPANLQRNIENVGGKLFLYQTKLLFEPHKMNIQNGNEEITLASISEVSATWTRFVGFIPLPPNALKIKTHGGHEHVFTLWQRHAWKDAIDRARAT